MIRRDDDYKHKLAQLCYKNLNKGNRVEQLQLSWPKCLKLNQSVVLPIGLRLVGFRKELGLSKGASNLNFRSKSLNEETSVTLREEQKSCLKGKISRHWPHLQSRLLVSEYLDGHYSTRVFLQLKAYAK